MAGKLRCERLTSPERIEEERVAWTAIVAEKYSGNPFLSIDWSLLWLKHFAGQGEICFLKISDDRCVRAYFPFVTAAAPFHGIPVKTLQYAGNLYSPINCPLLRDPDPAAVMAFLVRDVLPRIDWRLFHNFDLPEEIPGAVELQTAFRNEGHHAFLEENTGNWIFDRPGVTSEEYFARVSPNLRNLVRRKEKKLSASGGLRFRFVGSDLSDSDIASYQTIYALSWKEPEFAPDFHPDLMRVAAARGWLRLGLLYLAERPIASHLWLVNKGRGYMVKTAYDEAYKEYSPGSILSWRLIERLIETDAISFLDYLKGDDEYKKAWTDQRRTRHSLLCFRRGLYGNSLKTLDRNLLPQIRANPILDSIKRKAALIFNRGSSD